MVRFAVDDRQTVGAVKSEILKQIGNTTVLPGVLQLSFWACELKDAELFSRYQLPADCRISFTEGPSVRVTVTFESPAAVSYECANSTRIRDLKQFLCVTRGLDAAKYKLAGDSGPLNDATVISTLSVRRLTYVPRKREFVFSSGTGPVRLSLAPNATVVEAQRKFARLRGIALPVVLVLDGAELITDDNRRVSSLRNPSIAIGKVVRFNYGTASSTLRLTLDTTVAAMRPQLKSFIGEPCTAEQFDIEDPEGPVYDEDMTVEEIGDVDLLVIRPRKAAPPRHPRHPPPPALADARAAGTHRVPPSAAPPPAPPPALAPASPVRPPPPRPEACSPSGRGARAPPRLVPAVDRVRIDFQTVPYGQRFDLTFQRADTVNTARIRVAEFLGLRGPESVALRANGVELRDQVVLSDECPDRCLLLVHLAE
jgi:hypothetical protein